MKKLIFLSLILTTSFAFADVRQELQSLYPEQTAQTLTARIQNVNSPWEFFRAFPPHFYLLLQRGTLSTPSWQGLKAHRGWCIGDAHPENFGVLLNDRLVSIYTVNDPDDGAQCPLIADLLRFQSSWSLAMNRDLSIPLLQAYLASLSGVPAEQPPVIRAALAEASRLGTTPPKKWIDRKTSFLKRNAEVVNLPPGVEEQLRLVAQRAWGTQWRFLDAAERIRLTGGSGGLRRFLVLLQGNSAQMIVEFKQISRPAPFPVGVPPMDELVRMQQVLQWQQAPVLTIWNTMQTLAGLPFTTRPLWNGNVDIDLNDIPPEQLVPVAIYQASLLGAFHRSGFTGDLKAWQRSLQELRPTEWPEAMRRIILDTQGAFGNRNRP